MNWLINKITGISPDKAIDHVASGLGAIKEMIDERNFTPEEESKANLKLVDKGIEWHGTQVEENSLRSKARRAIAEEWIRFYLRKLLPGYLGVEAINIFYPKIQALVIAFKYVMVTMTTGTILVLGFYFGTHALRAGIKIAKGK